jgi:hypothetical protein
MREINSDSRSSDAKWHRSSHCLSLPDCVEVARAAPDGDVAVRDSKDIGGPVLVFTPPEWRFFVDGIKHGDFDR